MEYDTLSQVPDTLLQVPDTTDYLHAGAASAAPRSAGWQPLSLDSVFAAWQPQAAIRHQSLFTEHSLQTRHDEAFARTVDDTPGWVFGTFIILVALLSLYLNSFRARISSLFSSAVSLREMGYFFRDNNFKRPFSIMPMMLLYAGALAMLVVFATQLQGAVRGGMHGLLNYLSFFGILVLYFLLKSGLINLLGNIFNNSNATKLYNANNFIYQFISCFLLLPLLLFAFYSSADYGTLAIMLLSIVCFFYLTRLFRGMKLILTNATSSKFYLFYYLCILEVVPLLIMGKQFISL